MRKLEFRSEPPRLKTRDDRVATCGPVGIRCYDYSLNAGHDVGALIIVHMRGTSSEAAVHGRGDTDEDAITAAENILREDFPKAWELYARTVLVGVETVAEVAA